MQKVKKSRLESSMNIVFGIMVVCLFYLIYTNDTLKRESIQKDELLLKQMVLTMAQQVQLDTLSVQNATCLLYSIDPNGFNQKKVPKNVPPKSKIKPKQPIKPKEEDNNLITI